MESTTQLTQEEQYQTEGMDPNLFLFEKAKIHINQIIGSWSTECSDACTRRTERYIDIDVETLRQSGEIGEDETMIPDRVIDTNIIREKGDIIAFLNAGYRLGIFKCKTDPNKTDLRKLELEVTEGLTYDGWYREFDRLIDGALLHKMDYLEVVFDASKPLHVGFEHKGYDRVFYNRKVSNIQDSEFLIILYEKSLFNLEQLKNSPFNFNVDQIQKIIDGNKDAKRENIIKFFKVYFKVAKPGGQVCVYVAWFANESDVSDWIKNPEQLHLGIYNQMISQDIDPITLAPTQSSEWQEAEVDTYPVFAYIYREDENEQICEKKGRSFLDAPQQEANTCLLSAFVNGSIKASSIYASPKQDDGDSPEMKQLDIKLVPDGIYSKPIEFFSKPYPSSEILQAIQLLDTKNATQSGRIATAVSNRKDARKTAQELSLAETEQSKITSTSLATFSEFLRQVLNFTWKIVQSQALQNKIRLLLVQTEMGYVNDEETLSQEFDIRPAGDTDVVEAEQEQQKLQQDWPVFQNFPGLAKVFIIKYIKIRYPKYADEFVNALNTGDPGKQLVGSLLQLLQGTTQPEEIKALPPAQQQGMMQVIQQATAYAQSPV